MHACHNSLWRFCTTPLPLVPGALRSDGIRYGTAFAERAGEVHQSSTTNQPFDRLSPARQRSHKTPVGSHPYILRGNTRVRQEIYSTKMITFQYHSTARPAAFLEEIPQRRPRIIKSLGPSLTPNARYTRPFEWNIYKYR